MSVNLAEAIQTKHVITFGLVALVTKGGSCELLPGITFVPAECDVWNLFVVQRTFAVGCATSLAGMSLPPEEKQSCIERNLQTAATSGYSQLMSRLC